MKKIVLVIVCIISCCQISKAQTELWGMTPDGGNYNAGTIFKTDGSGSNQGVSFSFYKFEGKNPSGALVQASDGNLYGMTYTGGTYDLGVIFQYNPTTNVYTKKLDFDGAVNGSKPSGALIQASDGNLYGLTSTGGTGFGVLFSFNPTTSIFTKKYDFTGLLGAQPKGSLIQASDGNLYGVTYDSGTSGLGVLFSYNITTNVYTKKVDFDGASKGSRPVGSLLQASDGNLYGCTSYGGPNNYGVLFLFNPTTSFYITRVAFTGVSSDGAYPAGSLIQATDGSLYGMTEYGGANNYGTLYSYNPTTYSYSKKLDFAGPSNGSKPEGSLVQASDGNLYGSTLEGGTNNLGVLFNYNSSTNTYAKKLDFAGTINGRNPPSQIMQANDGNLYAMSTAGGLSDLGLLYSYNPTTNNYSKKIDFDWGANGTNPYGSLIKANDGNFYGMAGVGGTNNLGVLFQYNSITNAYTKKIDFTGVTNGSRPTGSLVQASDGNLYGMTSDGGANNLGVIFQYNPITNIYTNKIDFSPIYNLGHPIGSLMQANDGNLYGLTYAGGTNNYGALFQYNPTTNICTKKYDFISGYVYASLIQATDGNLYGTINDDGGTNTGSIFQYNLTTNTFATKYSFIGRPNGSLVQATNGKLYGMTYSGGVNSLGVLFSYNMSTNTFTNNIDFAGSPNGGNPQGSLIQAIDGNLYGMTRIGGANNNGVLFQYNPTNNNFTKKLDFNKANGACDFPINTPVISNLFETCFTPTLAINTGTICIGSNYILNGTGATNYSWNTGATTPNVTVSPTVSTTYSLIGTTLNCSSTKTVNVFVDNTCQDVWPGDANSDGVADNLDVLELGLHYTQTGVPRTITSNLWQSYYSANWSGAITNGKNVNHSNCNGDGTINDDDTLAIYTNYNLTHAFKPSQTTTNPALSIVADQSSVAKGTWGTSSIFLGDATTTINTINGLAFTVNYNNTLLEIDSVWIDYITSFINSTNQNLKFRKRDFTNGKLYTATTHTISGNVNGYGKIATLHYKIKSALTTDNVLNLSISQANQSNASGVITPLTAGSATLMALGTSITTNLNALTNGNYISIHPNPTNGAITINSTTELQKIDVMAITGQLLMSEVPSSTSHTSTSSVTVLHLDHLANGVYFVNLYQNNRIVKREKIILHK